MESTYGLMVEFMKAIGMGGSNMDWGSISPEKTIKMRRKDMDFGKMGKGLSGLIT